MQIDYNRVMYLKLTDKEIDALMIIASFARAEIASLPIDTRISFFGDNLMRVNLIIQKLLDEQ